MDELDERDLAQVLHARNYAERFTQAGAPGHGQFLLIAKLSRIIDQLRAEVVRMQAPNLFIPADVKPVDLTRPPDTSKKPRGMA